MNASQHNLRKTLANQLGRFTAHALQRTRPQPPSGIRNNTIGAVIFAPFLDFQKSARPPGRFFRYRHIFKDVSRHNIADCLNLSVFPGRLLRQINNALTILSAHDKIHTGNSRHFRRRHLRIAAGNRHNRFRIRSYGPANSLA